MSQTLSNTAPQRVPGNNTFSSNLAKPSAVDGRHQEQVSSDAADSYTLSNRAEQASSTPCCLEFSHKAKIFKGLKALIMAVVLAGSMIALEGNIIMVALIVASANGFGTGLIEYVCNHASLASAVKKVLISALISFVAMLVVGGSIEWMLNDSLALENLWSSALIDNLWSSSFLKLEEWYQIVMGSLMLSGTLLSLLADTLAWKFIGRAFNFCGCKRFDEITIEDLENMDVVSRGGNRVIYRDPKNSNILYKLSLGQTTLDSTSSHPGDTRLNVILQNLYNNRYRAYAKIQVRAIQDHLNNPKVLTKCFDMVRMEQGQVLSIERGDKIPRALLNQIRPLGLRSWDNKPSNFFMTKAKDFLWLDGKFITRDRSNSMRTQGVNAYAEKNKVTSVGDFHDNQFIMEME